MVYGWWSCRSVIPQAAGGLITPPANAAIRSNIASTLGVASIRLVNSANAWANSSGGGFEVSAASNAHPRIPERRQKPEEPRSASINTGNGDTLNGSTRGALGHPHHTPQTGPRDSS